MSKPMGFSGRRNRPERCRQQQGFILAEAVVAIVLVGGLLLVLMRWQQTDALQQQGRAQVQYSQRLVAMVQGYEREFNRFPTDLSALVEDQIWQHALPEPNGMRWRWSNNSATAVELIGYLNTAAQAKWLAAQLTDARAVGKQVRVQVSAPVVVAEVDTDAFLHRYAVDGKPELNRLQSHLSLQGHDLLDVGTLTAQSLNSDIAHLEQLNAVRLDISERLHIGQTEWLSTGQGLQVTATLLALTGSLTVAGDVQLSGGDVRGVGWLQAETVASQNITSTALITDNLIADSVATETLQVTGHMTLAEAHIGLLDSDAVITENLSAQTLDALVANIDSVQAGMVYADDLSAQGHTLSENYQLLQSIQRLWDECVDVGGCR